MNHALESTYVPALETDRPDLKWIADLDRRERVATRAKVYEYDFTYTPRKLPAVRQVPRSQLVGLAISCILVGALACACLFLSWHFSGQ